MMNALLYCVVHFLLCSETANAKPEKCTGQELCIRALALGKIHLANTQ